MRVTLVYPPFDDQRERRAYYVAPPLGLLLIASYLERAGHSVTVKDFIFDLRAERLPRGPALYRECAERICAADVDLVGISTQCSTSPGAVNIARCVKELRPDTIILFGGHDVSFLARDYLQAFKYVDFVLTGEAELTTPLLVEGMMGQRRLSEVPGLAWREPHGEVRWNDGALRVDPLDSMLPPSYHLVDSPRDYFALSKRATMLIDSGRGCAYGCEFCQTTRLTGMKVRYRSPASLVSELKRYRNMYGEFQAYFVHDLFTARRSFVEALCRQMIDEGMRVNWLCRCRLDQVDSSLLKLMRQAGCTMLLYGVESGSEVVLNRMGKKFRPGSARTAIERTRCTVELGIQPSLSMVVGIPEESREDLNATMALASQLAQLGRLRVFVQLLSPLPGTVVAERAFRRLVYRGLDLPTAFSQGIEFDQGKRLPEDEALIRAWPQLFQCFYAVLPEDGDVDLRADICQAFTWLLEVYCRTFDILASLLGNHLDLFEEFRRDALSQFPGRRGLRYLSRTDLWDCFAAFARRRAKERGALEDPIVSETLRFEQLLGDVSRQRPIDAASPPWTPDSPFQLHPAAKVFRARGPIPWMDGDSNTISSGQRSFLVYATSERIACAPLLPEMADALDLLRDLNEADMMDASMYSRLARCLAPICALGVFEPARGAPVLQ